MIYVLLENHVGVLSHKGLICHPVELHSHFRCKHFSTPVYNMYKSGWPPASIGHGHSHLILQTQLDKAGTRLVRFSNTTIIRLPNCHQPYQTSSVTNSTTHVPSDMCFGRKPKPGPETIDAPRPYVPFDLKAYQNKQYVPFPFSGLPRLAPLPHTRIRAKIWQLF